ncbi:MAG TPA: TldD/PmbA family protein, partial [Candidatus Thermoplasmatota archaeon]|nr:TldD/PmbA family protein [Candidatus Thermoplasmatota archaeon]
YADVRVQRAWSASAELRDGKVEQLVAGSTAGAGVRVLVDGAWGFAFTSRLEDDAVVAAAGDAVRAAKVVAAHARERVKLAPVKAERATLRVPVRKRPSRVPLEDRLDLLKELDRIPRRAGMATRTLGIEDGELETRFLSSEGADLVAHVPRTLFLINVTAEAKGKRASYRSRLGGTQGHELLGRGAPEDLCKEACEAAARLATAKAPKGGRTTVLVDPDLAGVFAHEAMGHACEADLVVSGDSLLAGRVGEDLGNPMVSIADDPTLKGSFGFVGFDDEGVRGQRRLLVDKGRLKGFLHSRETAAKLGMAPNGAARAESYAHRPLVRMSNTILLPRDRSFEELLEGVRTGVYVKGTRGGQVDTARGTFHFSAQEAFAIERGELGQPLRDVSLSGNILTTLKRVDAVGKDFRLAQPGFCGKGQWVPVGDGGPHFRVRNCSVGGA